MNGTTALRVCDTAQYSRESPEYRLGVAQLKQWHEECRRKRLGLDVAEKVLKRKKECERLKAKNARAKHKKEKGAK